VARVLCIGTIFLGGAAGVFASSTNFQSVVLADAPVLYYQFNESAGAATNYGSLGAAFNATYFGTPNRAVPTATGDTGVRFAGEGDYLESASVAPGSLSGNPSFTAEAVFFVPTNGSAALWAPFLHWGVSEGTQPQKTMTSVYFSFSNYDANRLFAGFYNGGLRTKQPVVLGQWHHILWVRQGGGAANLGSALYVDGVSVDLEDDPGLPSDGAVPAVVATAFRINRAQDFTRYFTGTLDELVLYDRVLTSKEVLAHYAAYAGFARLSIEAVGATQARISWAPAVQGVVLQETVSLSPANWTNSASGATNPITVSTAEATKFYRLFKR
jgi:hypothetical protein